MNDVINYLGILLKLSHLLPFLAVYLILKRKKQLKYNNDKVLFLVGFCLISLNVFLIFLLNYLGSVNAFGDISYLDFNTYQFFSNILMVIGYLFLLISVLKLINKKYTTMDVYIFTTLFSFIVISIFAANYPLQVKLNIFSYFISILFLIISLLCLSELMKKYNIRGHILSIIGSFLILIDPALFMKTFINSAIVILNNKSELFVYYRFVSFLISSIGMTLVLIPNIGFLFKLTKINEITIKKSDSVIQVVIKRLFNETQKIYGRVTYDIYAKAFKQSNVALNDSLDLDGLSAAKQKKLLADIINVMREVFSPELTEAIIKKIEDKKNRKLLTSLMKEHS